MVSVKDSFSPAPSAARATNYHALASRHLQKQFVHACVCIFLCCYLCSFIISRSHGIGKIFPWTWTGIRAIVIFFAVFPLTLVRKVNLHVSSLQQRDVFTTMLRRLISFNTLRALSAYLFSAYIMTFLYTRNCSSSKHFSMLVTLNSYELPRVNERYLYLQLFSAWSAVVAAGYHTLKEVDLLEIPPASQKTALPQRLQQAAISDASRSIQHAIVLTFTTPIAYLLLRQPLYEAAFHFVRLLHSLPNSRSASNWPVDPSMLLSTFSLAFIGSFLWLWSNSVFSLYVSQPPIRKGRLISDKSLRPNETLLTGLSDTSRPLTQALAIVELQIISEQDKYRNRRVSLFEAGSPDAIQWQATLNSCLDVLKLAQQSMKAIPSQQASAHPRAAAAGAPAAQAPGPSSPYSVKVKQANIFRQQAPKVKGLEANLEKLKSANVSLEENQKQIAKAYSASEHLSTQVNSWTHNKIAEVSKMLPKPVQRLFESNLRQALRQTKLQYAVISCLRNLLLHSITDDTYGRVYKDVQTTLLVLLDTHTLLSQQLQQSSAAKEHNKQAFSEIEALKHNIAEASRDIGFSFQPYIDLSSPVVNYLKSIRAKADDSSTGNHQSTPEQMSRK